MGRMVRRVLALIATVALAAAAGGAATAHASSARLGLAGRHPVTVTGHGFHARERVRVRVHATGQPVRVRHVTATKGGRFSVRFPAVQTDPCTQVWASAHGARGTRASLQGVMQPDCMAR
jgi:hypothetical protein